MRTIATKDRPNWDDYFMTLAYVAATRATCDRKHVGCVLVTQENHVLATGYNGSPPNKPHCDDVGHEIVDEHCVRTVHAEANAVAQAARIGRSIDNAICYSTTIPCYDCAKMLLTAGVTGVVFHGFYQSRYNKSDKVTQFLEGPMSVRQMHNYRPNNVISSIEI